MGLFKSDLYRSFAFGFVAGVAALVLTMGSGASSLSDNVVPKAVAAAPVTSQ